MAKSTRSQDALLAVVVLLTLFAVPALEVYVQLTDRAERWGPAVHGLFGLGLVLSFGLGYRKWQRDRAAASPDRHLPRPPAASACASCGAVDLAFSMDGLVFCERCGRDAAAVAAGVAAARDSTSFATARASGAPRNAPPSRDHTASGARHGLDRLHVTAIALVGALMAGAVLAYFLLRPRDPAGSNGARDRTNNARSGQAKPASVEQSEADYERWERCMEKHCEAEKWAGEECQHTAEEGADLDEWCSEEWAAARRCSKKHCARFETE